MPLSLYNVFVPLTKRALRASGRDWCFIVLQFRALSTPGNIWYTQSTWFPGASVSGIPIIELRKQESDLEDSSVLDEHHTYTLARNQDMSSHDHLIQNTSGYCEYLTTRNCLHLTSLEATSRNVFALLTAASSSSRRVCKMNHGDGMGVCNGLFAFHCSQSSIQSVSARIPLPDYLADYGL